MNNNFTCISVGKFQKISDNDEHSHFVVCGGCLHLKFGVNF